MGMDAFKAEVTTKARIGGGGRQSGEFKTPPILLAF